MLATAQGYEGIHGGHGYGVNNVDGRQMPDCFKLCSMQHYVC